MKSLKYIYENELGFTCFDRYFEYLRSIEADLPESMREFALDWGRYELNGANTLHDARLRMLHFDQFGVNQLLEKSIKLEFELSAGQQYLIMSYSGVTKITAQLNPDQWPERPVDLLVHEISKDMQDGLFRHVFIFERGVKIDISFSSFEVIKE